MSLLDLWKKSPEQLQGKQVQQLVAIAGDGKLTDDGTCSKEFRDFLASVPSANLVAYCEQCLSSGFPDSGFVLQDIVNEVGARLGATATRGRYRGTVKHTGFDGLWLFPSNQSILIEVKTTDAYRIDLNTIAGYRRDLVGSNVITEAQSSMLFVVGRQDTGDLEAQIRGSRYAWDIRLISVDALLRLMSIKEEVEDPAIVQRIHSILIPRELTPALHKFTGNWNSCGLIQFGQIMQQRVFDRGIGAQSQGELALWASEPAGTLNELAA